MSVTRSNNAQQRHCISIDTLNPSRLKTRHAIKNPDSYAIFAQCARNGDCEDESDYYSDSDSD